jgi:hypothetical protein
MPSRQFRFLLAPSLGFLQGTFEKIHLHRLLLQQPLQLMDLLSVRRFMRVRPWRFFSWLEVIEFALPLVETPSAHSQSFARSPMLSLLRMRSTAIR